MPPANQALRRRTAGALLLLVQAASAAPAVGVPPLVLTDDDPCLDGRGDDSQSCSTGLLQRSGSAKLPQRRSSRASATASAAAEAGPAGAGSAGEAGEEAVKLSFKGTPVKHNIALVGKSHEGALQEAEAGQAARMVGQGATSLLADMRQLVTKVKQSGISAPEVRRMSQEYAQLLEVQAVPSITHGYKEHQRLLQAHARSFERCDADLRTRLETGAQLSEAHAGWSSMLQDCQGHEARLRYELTQCHNHLDAITKQKQVACSILNASDATGSGHNDSSMMQLKKNCQDATRAYVDQWSICQEGERFAETKRAECDSVLQSMHTANCARASQVSGVCDMYDLCREGMALAYTSAKEAARSWERYHKAEWLAVVTVRCFAEKLGSAEESSTALIEKLDHCEQLVANTTLLDLEYADVPTKMACTPITESPCVDKVAAGGRGHAQSSSGAGVASSESLPREAISFVQENIQSATVILPRNVNEALFRPLALPASLALVTLTGLVFLVRCMVSGGGQGKEHKDKARRPPAVNGAVEGGGLQLAVDDYGRLLCPELLVPSRSRCLIAVPQLAAVRRDGAFMIADKVGQPLFKASFSSTAVPAPEDSRSGAEAAVVREQVSLTRQDGSSLVLCELILPSGGSGRRQAECRIMQRNGQLFASLRADQSQASWLARRLKRASAEPPGGRDGFIFDTCSASGKTSTKGNAAWQVRVEGGPGQDQKLCVLDGAGNSMAVASRGANFTFDTGGQDFYRVEVGGELDTDLGLVTITLLAVDRLLTASRE